MGHHVTNVVLQALQAGVIGGVGGAKLGLQSVKAGADSSRLASTGRGEGWGRMCRLHASFQLVKFVLELRDELLKSRVH